MTSSRINLLPHREERRRRAKQHLGVLAAMTAVLGIVVAGAIYTVYDRQIVTQVDRNEFLTGEIKKLDKDIADINALKEQIQALLARKQIIETLQADRAQTVHLLEQLVRQMPEGVYLRSMKQAGMRIHVIGYAQSNSRVSTLMRNIEASPWLEQPLLVEVKAASVDKKRVSDFNMYLNLKRAAAPAKDAGKAPAKDAAPDAAKKG